MSRVLFLVAIAVVIGSSTGEKYTFDVGIILGDGFQPHNGRISSLKFQSGVLSTLSFGYFGSQNLPPYRSTMMKPKGVIAARTEIDDLDKVHSIQLKYEADHGQNAVIYVKEIVVTPSYKVIPNRRPKFANPRRVFCYSGAIQSGKSVTFTLCK